MLISRLLLVKCYLIVCAVLSGCAEVSEVPVSSEAVPVTAEPAPLAEVKNKKSDEKPTAISPDVMFMLLTAELAGQRGQYQIALEGYLEAAKRVKDPRFAAGNYDSAVSQG